MHRETRRAFLSDSLVAAGATAFAPAWLGTALGVGLGFDTELFFQAVVAGDADPERPLMVDVSCLPADPGPLNSHFGLPGAERIKIRFDLKRNFVSSP